VKGTTFAPDYVGLLSSRFGIGEMPEDTPPLIDRDRHLELARALREELGYGIYVTVVASHYEAVAPKKSGDGDPEHFEVATLVRRAGEGAPTAAWRVRLEVGQGLDSLVTIYPGADWQEREQYDLVGVVFEGHPDLRRIMLPEDWDGHPLRKDYAIDTGCVPWR